jgi:hypothetical protein
LTAFAGGAFPTFLRLPDTTINTLPTGNPI